MYISKKGICFNLARLNIQEAKLLNSDFSAVHLNLGQEIFTHVLCGFV